jgi:hypothetical protein
LLGNQTRDKEWARVMLRRLRSKGTRRIRKRGMTGPIMAQIEEGEDT